MRNTTEVIYQFIEKSRNLLIQNFSNRSFYTEEALEILKKNNIPVKYFYRLLQADCLTKITSGHYNINETLKTISERNIYFLSRGKYKQRIKRKLIQPLDLVGFKLEEETKAELIKEANEQGLTLSKYVATIINDRKFLVGRLQPLNLAIETVKKAGYKVCKVVTEYQEV